MKEGGISWVSRQTANENIIDDTLPDSPRHLGRHPARQPPQNQSKKSATPHPYTWSKNPYSPIAKAIWGTMENVCFIASFEQNRKKQKRFQRWYRKLWLEVKLPLQPDKLLNPSRIVDRNSRYSER